MEINDNEGNFFILTGSGDGEVKAWSLDGAVLQNGLVQTENGEVRFSNKAVLLILM
jgi:hypothetical protein